MRGSQKAQGAQRPSDEEITALYERCAPGVFRLCMSYHKNEQDSADALQETFLRWIEAPVRPLAGKHETAWLIVTAGNICKDMLRRRKNFSGEDMSALDQTVSEERGYADAELFEAICSLDAKYKTVIFLFYYEDMTVAQISEATGIKQSTVTSLLTRARRLLKKALGDEL